MYGSQGTNFSFRLKLYAISLPGVDWSRNLPTVFVRATADGASHV